MVSPHSVDASNILSTHSIHLVHTLSELQNRHITHTHSHNVRQLLHTNSALALDERRTYIVRQRRRSIYTLPPHSNSASSKSLAGWGTFRAFRRIFRLARFPLSHCILSFWCLWRYVICRVFVKSMDISKTYKDCVLKMRFFAIQNHVSSFKTLLLYQYSIAVQ